LAAFCTFGHPDFMLLNIHDWIQRNQVVFHSAQLNMAAVFSQAKRKATEIIAMQDNRLA